MTFSSFIKETDDTTTFVTHDKLENIVQKYNIEIAIKCFFFYNFEHRQILFSNFRV